MADSATNVGVRDVDEVYVCFVKDGEAVNAYVGLKSYSNAKALWNLERKRCRPRLRCDG